MVAAWYLRLFICIPPLQFLLSTVLFYAVLGILELNSIAQLAMMIKYTIQSDSNSTSGESDSKNTAAESAYITHISNVINTFLQSLHVVEYSLLIISLSKLVVQCSHYGNFIKCEDCRYGTSFGCTLSISNMKVQCCYLSSILLTVLFTALVFWPPAMYTAYYSSTDVDTVTFNVLIFVAHFSNWIIRIAMMSMTFKVIARWKTAIRDLESPRLSIEDFTNVYKEAGEDV